MKFEYICSGLDFINRNTYDRKNAPELCDKIRDMAEKMVAQHPHNLFGILFNAYVEKSVVSHAHDVWDGLTIQADSGGLQMQTLAHGKITDEAKEKIYKIQADWSTIAMSFDEIPIRIVGGRAEIHDMGTKYFDPDLIKPCATESGKNLARQIEFFLNEKTKAKPLMIIQGNCMDTYNQWAEIILKQVPQKHWKYIAGISSSSFSLGNGFREDVERAFTLTQLPVPDYMKKHVHLLGVGAMNRLIPAIQLRRSGAFSDDMLFSYDSTKHSGGSIRGQYQEREKIIQLSRYKDQRYYKAWQDISTFAENVMGHKMEEDDFYMVLLRPNQEWSDKYDGNTGRMYERNLVAWSFVLYSVDQTMKAIESMIAKEEDISKICHMKLEWIKPLSQIKTLQDYNHWMSQAGRHLKSKNVTNKGEQSSLEAFI